jgi:hypothetical protein
LVLDGMCELLPTGEVGGMTTMLLTPTKVDPVTLGPWQAAQPLLMPAWFITEPVKRAPVMTGIAAMLDPGPT